MLSKLAYSTFVSQHSMEDAYLSFLKSLALKECEMKNRNFIVVRLVENLLHLQTQEAYYILYELIENHIINPLAIKNTETFYFAQYFTAEKIISLKENRFARQFFSNFEDFYKDGWKIQKILIEEGVNPLAIATMLREDDIDQLKELSKNEYFKFNSKIEPFLYEKYSYINKDNVPLINYAAFYGSIKCFKFLLEGGAELNDASKFAVIGENEEIIEICKGKNASFEGTYEVAIEYHRNDIFKKLFESKIAEVKDINKLGEECIEHSNYELLSYLLKNGLKVTSMLINKSVETGNLYLTKILAEGNKIPNDILPLAMDSDNMDLVLYLVEQNGIDINARDINFYIFNVYFSFLILNNNFWNLFNDFETALMWAAENDYVDLAKLLLEHKEIDINAKAVSFYIFNVYLND